MFNKILQENGLEDLKIMQYSLTIFLHQYILFQTLTNRLSNWYSEKATKNSFQNG